MNILILLTILLPIVAYVVYSNHKRKEIERQKLRKIFAYLYQTKEAILYSVVLHSNFDKVQRAIPFIERKELEELREDFLKRSAALIIATYMHFEASFDAIRNNPFRKSRYKKRIFGL